MGFKVLIAESALADLKEIVEFVAQDDPAAAVRLGEKLIGCALNLQTMPGRFPFYDPRRLIRKMTVAPYLIFYSCDEPAMSVIILHFWHGARRSPLFEG
jgi:plasmid stabilization system protein ParE